MASIGGKAAGLISLPDGWTPPFVVLGRTFHRRWVRSRAAIELLGEGTDERAALETLLAHADYSTRAEGLIVRSNSPDEALNRHRGRFASVVVTPDLTNVAAAIDQVLAEGTTSAPVFGVAQLYIPGELTGHLSNERRVSERASSWLVEETGSETRHPRYWRLTASPGSTDLRAADYREVAVTLRGVAGQLRAGRDRVHCEWLWDGERIWIVQCDVVPAERSPFVTRYLGRADSRQAPEVVPSLAAIRELSEPEADSWRKLRKPVIFSALGMPRAPIFFIDGETFLDETTAGSARLQQDLAALIEGRRPLVIRCDLAVGTDQSDLSLPTSAPMTLPTQLIEFMEEQAISFQEKVEAPNKWAFLPAWLVPARASVMVLARPGAQVMTLDALWGFPDGVGVLPHDTYIHELTRDRIDVRRRFKGLCLLWKERQGWTFESVPPPYDWKPVLDDSEVRVASSWARRLADHLQKEVQLMVLARIGGSCGPDAMLPWHYTDHQVPIDLRGRTIEMPTRGIVRLNDMNDLEDPGLETAQGIYFRPSVELRRDTEFIELVGRKAASAHVPIYFEGSLLGHPYYILRDAGAEVVAVGQSDPIPHADEYNKLVRDRIPEIIRRGGASARIRRVDAENAIPVLRHKLVEEAIEALTANDEDLLAELADVVEVVNALVARTGAGSYALEAERLRRRKARGGFDEMVYLEETAPDVGNDVRQGSAGEAQFRRGSAERGSRSQASGPVHVIEQTDERLLLRMPVTAPLAKGLPVREQRVPIGRGVMTFRYLDRFIEVEVTAPSPGSPAGQLSLPIETETE